MPHREGFKTVIKQHINYHDSFKGIEIGCFKGEFCNAMLREFDHLEMVTIDHKAYLNDVIYTNREQANRLWLLLFPSDVAVQFLKQEYDFVFIDGDHSYEQCRKDIINYCPLVKKGGIIAGHNYHKHPASAHPGVHISVDEIFGDKVKLQEDFIWYVEVEK